MKSAISELTRNLQSLEKGLKQENKEIFKLSGEMIELESHYQGVSLEAQLMICSIQQN